MPVYYTLMRLAIKRFYKRSIYDCPTTEHRSSARPPFLDAISSQFLFPVDPFSVDFLQHLRLSTPNKPNKAVVYTHLRS